jgi:hypothetical protein
MRVGAQRRTPRRRATARVGRLAAAAALALLLAACGGEDAPDEQIGIRSPEDAAGAAHEALEASETFGFTATYVRTGADDTGEPEEYASSEGAVDLTDDRGRLVLQLIGVEEFDDPPEVTEPIELHWDAENLAAHGGEEVRSVPRAEARETGGLIGRIPDEPAGLATLLTVAREPEEIGSETVDGRETTRYRFAVDRRAAGQVGVPAELSLALAQGNPGVRLILEAWLDEAALPRRLAYVVEMDPLTDEESGRELLPARTVTATYDLGDFGAPVEVVVPAPGE